MNKLEVALSAADELGEGPWWEAATGVLWRVDILRHVLHSWHPASGRLDEWQFDDPIGFAVPTVDGGVVAGLATRLMQLDLDDGEHELIADAAPMRSNLRLNDGKTDRDGRVWAGTMTDDDSFTGAFYRLDGRHDLTEMVGGVAVSNGLGWSPDNTVMYYTDSGARTIWAFDFDRPTGSIDNRRVFATDTDCYPDGLTVDAEGGVWSAKWGGSRVVRYEPDGRVSEVVASPASQPTSCMFGGSDLGTLFVTTARVGVAAEELAATPAGSVLAAQLGVFGLRESPAVIPTA